MIFPILADYLDDLDCRPPRSVIPWACPVPYFGDPYTSVAATVGINPSNREFMDSAGRELDGQARRLPTLRSLGIRRWAETDSSHLHHVVHSYRTYFRRQPYDRWFRVLERMLRPSGLTYYDRYPTACHIDLFAFATRCKWSSLPGQEQRQLLDDASQKLALLVRSIPARVLILNGRAVVDAFELSSRTSLKAVRKPAWDLPRSAGSVPGIAYVGEIDELGGVRLDRTVTVVGFNHNMQSSFGVTSSVRQSIGSWLASAIVGSR